MAVCPQTTTGPVAYNGVSNDMSGQPDANHPEMPVETVSAELVEPQRPSGARACLIGCLIVFAIGVCLCGGVAWFVRAHLGTIRTFVADTAREAIVSGIQESDLDEDEKQAVIAQVDHLVEQYKSGEITMEQLGRVTEELAQSPLMGALVMVSIDTQYIQPSGLSVEEKEQAQRIMQRVLRGFLEEKIRQEELEDILDHVMDRREDGSREMKDSVSDGDLRVFVAQLKERADAAEIPDEPFEVKISEEFRQSVDRALAGQ
jgi:hypothetical protein